MYKTFISNLIVLSENKLLIDFLFGCACFIFLFVLILFIDFVSEFEKKKIIFKNQTSIQKLDAYIKDQESKLEAERSEMIEEFNRTIKSDQVNLSKRMYEIIQHIHSDKKNIIYFIKSQSFKINKSLQIFVEDKYES